MIDFLKEAETLKTRLSKLRQDFHREPEIGNREFKTAQRIEEFLHELGICTTRILDTAVVAKLEGKKPGQCVAFRADIDALPIQEKTDVEFMSKVPGMMHACGHDVHITALLGAASLLKAHVNELKGSVVFLFQPDEEGSGGAERMIKAGCLEGVNAVFGAHVSPELPAGHIGVRFGKFYASSATFSVIMTGKSAHGAERKKGIDALEATAYLVQKLLAIKGGVISVGTFNAGAAGNIIAERAEISGIIRALGIENRSSMCDELLRRAESASQKFGTALQCKIKESYPGIVNNGEMTSLVMETAKKLLGKEHVHIVRKPVMMTEDFGYFLMERPGSFYHVGAGCNLPLHNNEFLPDDQAIVTASAVHASVAMAFLDSNT